MKGLTPKTERIFEAVTRLDCIQPYMLVGGTALALQLGTRLSEDLDFMSWRKSRNDKREVNWPAISKELEQIGIIERFDIYGSDHVEFVVEGVKVSFYANPNYPPLDKPIIFRNNLRLATPLAIGAMKMEVMLRRSKFRDYYDIYSLLVAGVDLYSMIDISLKYSGHKLKSKNLLAMLTSSDRFRPDEKFIELSPIYDITPKDIELKIRDILNETEQL